MDAYREQLNRPLVAGIVGFIIGVIIGLVVLGWWLWPVQYVGAGPSDLRPEAKVQYLQMAVEAYAYTKDAATAKARYDALGADAPQVLQEVATMPGGPSPEAVQAFGAAVLGTTGPVEQPTQMVTPTGAEEQAGEVAFSEPCCQSCVLLCS